MNSVGLDFETRSKCVLGGKGGRGMYAYAEDPSTDVLCLAVKINDQAPKLWVPDKFKPMCSLPLISDEELLDTVNGADILTAHNIPFERCIWREIMHKRYGFPDLPLEKCRCTAARASLAAMPRALDKLAMALDLEEQKDSDGKRIMLRWCKPRNPLKADKAKYPDWENMTFWHEKADEFDKLCLYCLQDTNTEYACAQALPVMPDSELAVWMLDQQINDRGVQVDVEAVNNLITKVEFYTEMKLKRFQHLTNYELNSPKQTVKLKDWLEVRGLKLDNLQKETIEKVLNFYKECTLHPNIREILEIKLSLGKASVTKLDAMRRYAQRDSRARGVFMFAGAGTARWTARGLQVHNYPRETFPEEEMKQVLKMGVTDIADKYGDVMGAISKCLRGMLTAAEGKGFIGCDFSSIEARVLAWLAGEDWKLLAFNEGHDMYKVSYSRLFNVPLETVTKDERQIGKVAELALGFSGWVNAFNAMARGYGLTLEEEIVKDVILKWRDNHPNVVALWHGVEQAAIRAIKTGQVQQYRRLVFGIIGRWLYISLPSGRCLYYYDPSVVTKEDKYKRVKETIRFKGEVNGQWVREHTYGGKLVENCLAGDTLVLTHKGFIPIRDIDKHHLLWDGDKWVGTQGVKHMGRKEVGLWLGIRLTGNHKILVGDSWKKATRLEERCSLEALRRARSLAPLPLLIRVSATSLLQNVAALAAKWLKPKQGACSGAKLQGVSPADIKREPGNEINIKTSSATTESVGNGNTYTQESYQDATTKSAKRIRTMVREVSQCMKIGERTDLLSSSTLRLWLIGIRSIWNLTVSTTIKATYRETLEWLLLPLIRGIEGVHIGLLSTVKRWHLRLSGRSIVLNGSPMKPSRITAEKGGLGKRSFISTGVREDVYDLINCGPDNRFTVLTSEGLAIVHNCTQAVARDLLAEAMIRLNAKGFPTALHIHDDDVSEVPKEYCTAEYLKVKEQIMSEVPAWAKGCPISAEGWYGFRFRK